MPQDVAAGKIGVSEARLRQFETGDAQLTIKQLRTVAQVYRRPTAFFYFEALPPKPERIQDFRVLPEGHDRNLPELLDAVEAARERRRIASQLANLLGQEVADFDVVATLHDPPERIANQVRNRLAISLATQRTWRDPYRVLRSWINAVENAGILVTQFSGIEVAVARGFSLTDRPYPLVAINGKDFPRGKVFTLFHELAHIVIGASGLCDLHDAEGRAEAVEPFCNRIAAEALVPTSDLLTEPLVTHHDDIDWEDWRLRELAMTYGVSAEVLLRRLLTLGRTTEAFYQAKREEYLRAYEEAAAEGGGFLAYFRRVLRDNGTALTQLILDAYRADLVTPTEVSRFLGGVKLTHVPAIEKALEARDW